MTTKLIRVRLINTQTLHAEAGYGEGRTREEAIQDALRRVREQDPQAYYCESCGAVCFAGGANS